MPANPWDQMRTMKPTPEEELEMLLSAGRAPADVGQPKFIPPKTPLVLAPAPATQTQMNKAASPAVPKVLPNKPKAPAPVAPPADSVGLGDLRLDMLGVKRGSGFTKNQDIKHTDQVTDTYLDKAGEEDKNQTTSNDTRGLREDLLMSSDQFRHGTGNTRSLPEYQGAKRAEAKLENMLAMEGKRETRPDLSALASLIDTWTGSNFAKTYQAPEQGNSQQERIMKHFETLQDAKRKSAELLVDSLAKQKAGYTQEGSALGQLSSLLMSKGNQNGRSAVDGLVINNQIKAADPMTMEKAKGGAGKGLKTLPEKSVGLFSTGQEAIELTNRMVRDIAANKDVMGPAFGQLERSPFTFGSEKIERAKRLQAQLGLHQQTVGKLFEGGVLRKEDEIKYNKLFANIRQNPDVAVQNMKLLEAQLRTDVTRYMENMGRAKYDISGFKDQLDSFRPQDERAPIAPAQTPKDTRAAEREALRKTLQDLEKK